MIPKIHSYSGWNPGRMSRRIEDFDINEYIGPLNDFSSLVLTEKEDTLGVKYHALRNTDTDQNHSIGGQITSNVARS